MIRYLSMCLIVFMGQSEWADDSRSSLGINFSWASYWSEDYPGGDGMFTLCGHGFFCKKQS